MVRPTRSTKKRAWRRRSARKRLSNSFKQASHTGKVLRKFTNPDLKRHRSQSLGLRTGPQTRTTHLGEAHPDLEAQAALAVKDLLEDRGPIIHEDVETSKTIFNDSQKLSAQPQSCCRSCNTTPMHSTSSQHQQHFWLTDLATVSREQLYVVGLARIPLLQILRGSQQPGVLSLRYSL